jgi:hypothetical protein
MIKVCRSEGIRQFTFFIFIPFKFIRVQYSIPFLDIIYFLLAMSAPEISVGINFPVADEFFTFAYHEVFPQGAYVIAKCQWSEIVYDGITHPLNRRSLTD